MVNCAESCLLFIIWHLYLIIKIFFCVLIVRGLTKHQSGRVHTVASEAHYMIKIRNSYVEPWGAPRFMCDSERSEVRVGIVAPAPHVSRLTPCSRRRANHVGLLEKSCFAIFSYVTYIFFLFAMGNVNIYLKPSSKYSSPPFFVRQSHILVQPFCRSYFWNVG